MVPRITPAHENKKSRVAFVFRGCFAERHLKIKFRLFHANFGFSPLNVTTNSCWEADNSSMNVGKNSQLGKHGSGSLHNFTWACYLNKDILLRTTLIPLHRWCWLNFPWFIAWVTRLDLQTTHWHVHKGLWRYSLSYVFKDLNYWNHQSSYLV